MDENSNNNKWLSISSLSMEFNEQPYLLNCVCVCCWCTLYMYPIFSYENFRWWNSKRMCLWQPVCVYVYYLCYIPVTQTLQLKPILVLWCLFVCFLFAFKIGCNDRYTYINTNTNICKALRVGVVTDIDIQMLIIPLSKKDIYLSKE